LVMSKFSLGGTSGWYYFLISYLIRTVVI